MKKILKYIALVTGIVIAAFLVFLLFMTLSDYKPEEIILVGSDESADPVAEWAEYDLMIWNIGYCGLDASMDFFYDGGKQVRPSKTNVIANLGAVRDFLRQNDSVEFILLQEVDQDSRRSYGINQYDSIRLDLSGYYSVFGMNYNVPFVPLPPRNPMGRVKSGLQTLSRFKAAESSRYSFPGNYSWPTGVFMLDRCFLVNRYPVPGGKEFVLVNTHNSAYDDGSLRAGQMEYLKTFLLDEYAKGNYVITGGDWNQTPFGFPGKFEDYIFDELNYSGIPEGYPAPDWTWAWDGSLPTNRRVIAPYDKNVTPVTLIDCFLLSPNIQPVLVKTMDLDFKNSDHQPVFIKIHIQNTANN